MTPNASVLETVWTSIALLGAGFATALLVHIWLSYRAVLSWIKRGLARRWGPRHKFALGFLLGVALLLVVWCGFVALGANAVMNPPPVDEQRAAASERGGWILVCLEATLFVFQAILMWAWIAVGRPTLHPGQQLPTLADLLEEATEAGREMGHLIANSAQLPVAVLEEVAGAPSVPERLRADAARALVSMDELMEHARSLHAEIKRIGGRA